ncbi:TPA: hypothetical protein N2930_001479 [Vibrio parahaemolyticus]|uniref:hypothetical protein n=1 Tax=Vibrio harveyi group TaxID=717610 RepID=UPI00146C48A6|nr:MULTISPECIES: hypothetical protein [Vibrio harveyi group]EGQ7798585.1 hypothetical protein [Vibrio parahaemolyticus]EGQ8198887.1 hypothetical protein [Vibrio parahaemolyticus]EGU0149786.1 hypothetical protein [Vibrio parahaemolyticus]EJS4060297.1 hypothetical protein [Vibrio parahaemolyticus]EJV0276176.1 hypothetical protein [Vibrio parahaemolyticus]
MRDLEKRIQAAKERMRTRHDDKDKSEVKSILGSFNGLSPEQIRKNFLNVANQRH